VSLIGAAALALAVWVVLGGLDRSRPHLGPVTVSVQPPVIQRDLRRPRLGTSRRTAAVRIRIAGIEALAAIAGELAAGAPAEAAVLRVGSDHPDLLVHAVAAARFGGDIALGLERDGCGRAPILCDAAIAWRVGATTGAGLAAALRALVQAARDSEDIRTSLESQLAAPRATARVLATLPVIGIGAGMLLGADPLDWLLGSAPGLLCLGAAVVLTLLGLLWMRRIARGVEDAL